ncbi:hypothetical protein [Georgenia thermotolerans]|uniref:Uncharacterized protein n=1 Tax=Georgenia thermotolerans TaxID=527326 RepID=A0A7J5UME6_9MICO|nr:hypothetical protein [Georgenia thermotolerans]KAE8763549.1 hypothetical protein GB883_13625 [Georgenia thermotolerans]
MEGLTSIVLGAVGLWGLYWVVRAGVRGGLLDAAREWARTAAALEDVQEDGFKGDAAVYDPGVARPDGPARTAPRPPLDTLA